MPTPKTLLQFHPRFAEEGAAAEAPGGGSLIPPGGGGRPPRPRAPPPVLGRDLAVVAAPSEEDLGMLILIVWEDDVKHFGCSQIEYYFQQNTGFCRVND